MNTFQKVAGLALMMAALQVNANDNRGIILAVDVGPGCTLSSIQDGIDAGFNDIRIVDGTYTESILINNKSLSLKGGFSDCNAAVQNTLSVDADAASVILESAGSTTMFVIGENGSHVVTLSNLTIRDGNGVTSAGGLNIAGNNIVVTDHARITANTGNTRAAGASVFGPNAHLILRNTEVDNNIANEPLRAPQGTLPVGGGGIWCLNGRVTVDEGSVIHSNSAPNGGGILASNCTVSVFAGDMGEAIFFPSEGILLNSASGHGGGIYAVDGSEVLIEGAQVCNPLPGGSCQGDPATGVAMVGNEADTDFSDGGDGGAIYANGPETSVTIHNTTFALNTAHEGGALFADNGASITIQKAPGQPCWSARGYDCVAFTNNSAADAGAIFVGPNVNVTIAQSYFTGNTGRANTAVYYGFQSNSLLEGNIIAENGETNITAPEGAITDQYVIRQWGGELTFAHNTVTANLVDEAIIFLGALQGSDVILNLYHNLILNDPQVDVFETPSGNVIWDADCTIVTESDSAPNDNGLFVEVDDGNVFVGDDTDPYTSPYHIQPFSLAEDICDTSSYTAMFADIDGEARLWDNTDWNDVFGPLDIGADETYLADIIFRSSLD